jgi:hypothetical protein
MDAQNWDVFRGKIINYQIGNLAVYVH